jgi:hypothetical protein
MALTRSILSLITDGDGKAKTDFLLLTPAQWADQQMLVRYSMGKMATDSEDYFPYRCWETLCKEYLALRTWFSPDGTLQPLLQSAAITNRLSGPLGDGIGWDFKTNGDPDLRMTSFKTTLIAACRAAEGLPAADRNSGNGQFGGLAMTIRNAYTERASIHRWVGVEDGDVKFTGADMSRRWAAHMTFTFIIRLGADRKWAWEASKCKTIFGPVDEERQF